MDIIRRQKTIVFKNMCCMPDDRLVKSVARLRWWCKAKR